MNVLVVYYSFSGNTKRLARDISLITDGDLWELTLKEPYDFSKNTTTGEIRRQIKNGHCPELVSGIDNIDCYDLIFIGTPNWLKTFAPPIRTFIRDVNLVGKTIVPFCTHGGGGIGNIYDDLKNLCSECNLKMPIYFNGSYTIDDLKQALNQLLAKTQ